MRLTAYRKNTLKKPYRALCIFMSVLMLFCMLDLSAVTSFAAENGGFSLKLRWSGSNQDASEYGYYSDSDESRLIRLRVSYSNEETKNSYESGDIVISVPGLRSCIRSGESYIPVAIAADKAADKKKVYDFSYTYSSVNDIFTFTNNNYVDKSVVFKGSFEIIWIVPSRESKDNSSKTLKAQLITSNNESTQSNSVLYSQRRLEDQYSLELRSSRIPGSEGLRKALPEGTDESDYKFVKYDLYGTDVYNSRDLITPEVFRLKFPENVIIQGINLTDTGETEIIDGIVYHTLQIRRDVSADVSPFLSDIFVAYPKELYLGKTIAVYAEIYGTYYETSEEVLLASDDVLVNLNEYDYVDIPGSLYYIGMETNGVHSSFIDFHCPDCSTHGGVNSDHLANGKGTYYSTLRSGIHYHIGETRVFDLEVMNDILDVDTIDGNIRQLRDDEYNFSGLVIPSEKSVRNLNGFPVDSSLSSIEIYLRHANGEFEDEPFKVTKLEEESQEISLPDDTVGVRIWIRNVTETYRYVDIRSFFVMHTDSEDIDTSDGRLFNNMYLNIWEHNTHEWINSEYDHNPSTYTTGREYQRDLEIYGHTFDREVGVLHMAEIPNEYSSSTAIEKTGEEPFYYLFDASFGGAFKISDESYLEKFSIYSILPEGMSVQSYYENPDKLIDVVNFRSTIITAAYTREHCSARIINDFRNSGRQCIIFDFDFRDSPVKTNSITVSGIPLCSERDPFTTDGKSKSYTLTSLLKVDQKGFWFSNARDNQQLESGIWYDIDDNGSPDEYLSRSNASVSFYTAVDTRLELSKTVKTSLTNNYERAMTDDNTGEYIESTIPSVYSKSEYSYRLCFMAGEKVAGHIIVVDTLETGSKMQWQGTFSRVDTKYAKELFGNSPNVYYSSQVVDPTKKPDFSKDGWTTVKPQTVKSIAFDFGESMLPESEMAYVDIYMTSPANPTSELDYTLTENGAYAYYDFYNSDTLQYEGSSDSESNLVPLQISPSVGKLKVIKKDEVSSARIEGTVFELYEQTGEQPDPQTDRLITDSLTTNDYGVASIRLVYGDYYIKEIKASSGYILDDTIHTISMRAEQSEQTFTVEVTNKRKPGQASIKKISDLNKDYFIKGAVFDLYDKDDKLILSDLTTDEKGELFIDNLEWGTYTLKEKSCPDGFTIKNPDTKFVINAANDAGRKKEVTIINEQCPAVVELVKKEMLEDGTTVTEKGVDGAVYKLYYRAKINPGDDDFDASSGDKEQYREEFVGSYITDENGKIYVEDLLFGDYYFIESVAALGYDKNPEKIEFTVDGRNLRDDNTVYIKVNTIDKRTTGRVWLEKKDDKGSYVANAVYGLYRESDDVPVDNTGKESDVTFRTDSEGTIFISDIYWGDYYIKEIRAPKGYAVDPQTYHFSVNRENAKFIIMYNVIDNRLKGSVQLTKADAEHHENVLEGAVYTLYRNNGSVFKDDLVTGADGTIKVDNLEWGTYYFQEKSPPPGYGLSDEKIRFSVNYLTAGKLQTVTAFDKVTKGELTVTKKIAVRDIVLAHGEPTFTFRLTGTNSYGEQCEYIKQLTFGSEFVNSVLESNYSEEYIQMSVVFTDLGMGTWTVSELQTLRYSLESAEALTANGTANADNSVSFVFDDDNGYNGTALFTNKKQTQQLTSHTSNVINIVKLRAKPTAIVALWGEDRDPDDNDILTDVNVDRSRLDLYVIYDDGTQELVEDDSAYQLHRPGEQEENVEFDENTPDGEYTINVTYDIDGEEFTDSFVVEVKLPQPFTWTVREEPFTAPDGTKYDGTAAITGYTGKSPVINIPSEVYGIRTLTSHETGTAEYEDNGKNYLVTSVIGEVIDDTVSVGKKQFHPMYGANKASSVIFPDSVTVITEGAFFKCTNLEGELHLPKNLEVIGRHSFYGCNGFTGSLVFPDTMTLIDDAVFISCDGFTGDLHFPDGITKIGMGCFQNCSGFNGTLHLPANLTMLDDYAFNKCANLTGDLILPEGLSVMGRTVFQYCSGFDGKLVISPSLTEIKPYSFNKCESLTGELHLPVGIETIGQSAFQLCSSLTGDLVIPSTVTRIEDYAFNSCSSLTGDLIIPDSVITIGKYSFRECRAFNGSLVLSKNLEAIPDQAFENCVGLKGDLIIPDSVTKLGFGNFYGCSGFDGVLVLSKNIEEIPDFCFNMCTNLTGGITIPDSVTRIGENAFQGDGGFNGDLIMSKNIKRLERRAFWRNTNLTGVVILPACLEYIGQAAFWSDNSIAAIYYPSTAELDGEAFVGYNGSKIVYTPGVDDPE